MFDHLVVSVFLYNFKESRPALSLLIRLMYQVGSLHSGYSELFMHEHEINHGDCATNVVDSMPLEPLYNDQQVSDDESRTKLWYPQRTRIQ